MRYIYIKPGSIHNQDDNSIPRGALSGKFPKRVNPSHNTMSRQSNADSSENANGGQSVVTPWCARDVSGRGLVAVASPVGVRGDAQLRSIIVGEKADLCDK